MKDEWFLNILKDMIKNKYVICNLGKMKIVKEKDTMTTFNFNISVSKSLFEDILSEKEKSMLWLESEMLNENNRFIK